MSDLEDWGIGQLGALCSIEIGGTPSRNVPRYWDVSKESGNHWVSIRDLKTKIITFTEEQITDEGVKRSNVKLQAKGSVLLSFKLTIGRVAIAGVPLYTNEAIAGLSSERVTHDFLVYGLQQWDLLQGVDQAIKGATLNKEKLKRIEFEYPPRKPEQTKIAEILSTVDRAIEQTEALIAKQQRIKTGLMQDLLTRGIDEHGNLRSEETHEFKDSPLGRVPAEWSCGAFGDLWIEGAQNGLYKPQSAYSEDGIPIVRIDGFRNGDVIDRQTFRRLQLNPTELRAFALTSGDLVVNRVNSIEWLGKVALVGKLNEATVFESNMMRIRVDREQLLPEFAILILSSPHAYRHFLRCAKTAIAQASVNQEDVLQLLVTCPPPSEQAEIVRRVEAMRGLIGDLFSVVFKLLNLKTALMQDLLTGKKRVTPLLELQDPASQTP